MSYADRVVEEMGTLAGSVEHVAEHGAVRGWAARKPGRPGSQAPTDLEALSWLEAVNAAVGEWAAETDRVLSVDSKRGTVAERIRDLAFKVRVVEVKTGVLPTWCADVWSLSRLGRQLSGDAARFVQVFEQCPICGGALAADLDRWVLACMDRRCLTEGRRSVFAIDIPVEVARIVRHGVRFGETVRTTE